MTSQSQKRKSDELSPVINDAQKRYLWNADDLIRNNRYHNLSNDQDNEPTNNNNQDNDDNNLPDRPPARKYKIPPIFVHNASNHQEIISDIKKIARHEFSTTYSQKYLKINLNHEDDYRKLRQFYSDNKIQCHTFQDPNNKPLSVILRSVPISLTNDEIKKELLDKDLPVISVTRLLNKEKMPIPLCAVELTASELAAEVYKVTEICHAVITVEPRRKSAGIPQCHNCQRFGHTKNYCSMKPRCVKCDEEHPTSKCTKKSGDPKCVNCGGPHPANYKGCNAYKELQQKRSISRVATQPNSTTVPNQNVPRPAPIPTSTLRTSTRLYANVARNSTVQNAPTDARQEFPIAASITDKIFQLLKEIITPLLSQIKSFILNDLIPNIINV